MKNMNNVGDIYVRSPLNCAVLGSFFNVNVQNRNILGWGVR